MYFIRDMQEEDKPFIYSTWLRGLYYGSPAFEDMDRASFFANYHNIVGALLSKSIIKVAHLPESPDVILGYVVYSGHSLHWIFVKKAFRKMGIGRALIPESGISKVTHMTSLGRSIKPANWVYDPFAL